jgi:hypothetical protein
MFLLGLIVYMDVTPHTQIQRCYAYWRRCANGTCQSPSLDGGGGIPTCENMCRSDALSQGCCSGYAGTIEPSVGCGNPGEWCEGNLYNQLVVFKECTCAGTCRRDDDGDGYSPDDPEPDWDCDDNDTGINPGIVPTCDSGEGQDFNCDGEEDIFQCDSPIVIDVSGDGFELTDGPGGVSFDLNGDGAREQISWTAAGSDDAWLALDRDQNGQIDNGGELFGNFTQQPPSDTPNGFSALALFDLAEAGGNGDGWIGAADAVFSTLRLWRDENHDGVSQLGELRSLGDAGISGISTEYRDGGRRDRWGNRFRYRGKVQDVKGRHAGQWAYDVFLVR